MLAPSGAERPSVRAGKDGVLATAWSRAGGVQAEGHPVGTGEPSPTWRPQTKLVCSGMPRPDFPSADATWHCLIGCDTAYLVLVTAVFGPTLVIALKARKTIAQAIMTKYGRASDNRGTVLPCKGSDSVLYIVDEYPQSRNFTLVWLQIHRFRGHFANVLSLILTWSSMDEWVIIGGLNCTTMQRVWFCALHSWWVSAKPKFHSCLASDTPFSRALC